MKSKKLGKTMLVEVIWGDDSDGFKLGGIYEVFKEPRIYDQAWATYEVVKGKKKGKEINGLCCKKVRKNNA